MFRVVPDQLRVSEGWVRCGECDEVFDANAHLRADLDAVVQPKVVVERSTLVQAPVSVAAPDASTVAAPAPAPVVAPQPEPVMPMAEPEPEPEPELGPELEPEPEVIAEAAQRTEPLAPEYDAFLQARPAASHALHDTPARFTLNMSALGDMQDPPLPTSESLRYVQADAPLPATPGHATVADLSFMRKPRQHTFWEGTAGRRVLGWGSILAAVLLLLQLLVGERERWIAMQPALQPALEGVCHVLGCPLHGFYQIESLMIDSSGFAKVRADTYRLSFNLRNAGSLAVAVPALELTLTDSQDQPVLRRVLRASEFSAQQATLAAGADLNVSVPLEVEGKFSGYRLFAFYP